MTLSEKDRAQMIAWRRDFHAHPEPGYQETRTAGIVAGQLAEIGCEVTTGVAETGVVGMIRGKLAGRTVMLRADMDCLPLQEENDVPYKSKVNGKMHACGHDGHTAILLAVAGLLAETRQRLNGNVKLIFQPAEEGGNGAERMVKQGALRNPMVDAAFGLHLWTHLPVGQIGLNPGALMAGVHSFEVRIIGRGGHGAAPHQTVDAIVTAAQAITALQTVVSRSTDPLDTAVVSVGSIHAGSAFNIIPETATFTGTARYFNNELGDQLPQQIERVIQGVASAMGARYELEYQKTTPPTINNRVMANFVREVAVDLVGANNVVFDARTMGGEDMSFFLNEVPGCFFFVGAGNSEKNMKAPHHSPRFDFDEAALDIGVEMFCRIVEKYLA